jgi:hypothetical protein
MSLQTADFNMISAFSVPFLRRPPLVSRHRVTSISRWKCSLAVQALGLSCIDMAGEAGCAAQSMGWGAITSEGLVTLRTRLELIH